MKVESVHFIRRKEAKKAKSLEKQSAKEQERVRVLQLRVRVIRKIINTPSQIGHILMIMIIQLLLTLGIIYGIRCESSYHRQS